MNQGEMQVIKPASDKTSRKQGKRKIKWFNPPFALSVKTNLGRTFLKLLKQHFQNPTNQVRFLIRTL